MTTRPSRTRIKVCGLTRPADIALALALGADAVGLVRVRASARFVSLDQGRQLREAVNGLVHCVVLFMNPRAAEVREAIAELAPTLLQFHGQEDAPFCAQFGVPYIKALNQQEFVEKQAAYGSATALLIDSHKSGGLGGTGKTIDAGRFPVNSVRPLLLAGGLNPANVAEVIQTHHPYGVDVSSGLESAPGIKDPDKMTDFFQQVRHADDAA